MSDRLLDVGVDEYRRWDIYEDRTSDLKLRQVSLVSLIDRGLLFELRVRTTHDSGYTAAVVSPDVIIALATIVEKQRANAQQEEEAGAPSPDRPAFVSGLSFGPGGGSSQRSTEEVKTFAASGGVGSAHVSEVKVDTALRTLLETERKLRVQMQEQNARQFQEIAALKIRNQNLDGAANNLQRSLNETRDLVGQLRGRLDDGCVVVNCNEPDGTHRRATVLLPICSHERHKICNVKPKENVMAKPSGATMPVEEVLVTKYETCPTCGRNLFPGDFKICGDGAFRTHSRLEL